MLDPNTKVNGKGKVELEKAGIPVRVGEHSAEASEIIEAYCKHITTGLPFVTAKFAMSLDGKIATRTGDSKWISGEESRRYVHYLRYINDAIMVGVNTVLTDDPQLTVRCCSRGGTSHKQPVRVIVDSTGRTPSNAQVFNAPGKAILATGRSTDRSPGVGLSTDRSPGAGRPAGAQVESLMLPVKRGMVDLPPLLRALGERDITGVLVEGGGTLLGSLFDQKLVDKVIVFVAPMIIGGKQAKTPVAGKGVASVIDSIKLERVRTRAINGDIMITGYAGKDTCLPA
jgi:diaminohydroxyphosphoribosylaminopyrimidine deaminase/5-amino-6-(5-phosphoribosylamino)uracil reductase